MLTNSWLITDSMLCAQRTAIRVIVHPLVPYARIIVHRHCPIPSSRPQRSYFARDHQEATKGTPCTHASLKMHIKSGLGLCPSYPDSAPITHSLHSSSSFSLSLKSSSFIQALAVTVVLLLYRSHSDPINLFAIVIEI